MSVKVNLLPEDVKTRGDANRSRILVGVAFLALLAVLGGLWFLQQNEIDDAEARLAGVQEQNTESRADIAALQPFADLEARADLAVTIVSSALANEGSLATVLQDLSTVLPPNVEISSLAVTLADEPRAPVAGGARLVYGQLAATGRVIDGVAPGVERLIIDLDRVAAFENAFVTTSTLDEEGVATFTIEAELGPEALTGRYVIDQGGAG